MTKQFKIGRIFIDKKEGAWLLAIAGNDFKKALLYKIGNGFVNCTTGVPIYENNCGIYYTKLLPTSCPEEFFQPKKYGIKD